MTKGITEDGFDLHEEQVRVGFEFWAIRKGFDITRMKEHPWMYEDDKTDDVWRAYHLGHVRGREFNEK